MSNEKKFVLTDLIFCFSTREGVTQVSYFATHGTPEWAATIVKDQPKITGSKSEVLAGTITSKFNEGPDVYSYLVEPAKPSHPSFARVAFFSQEAAELFLKSQIMDFIVGETI